MLNSKLYYLWLYYRGKRKGEILELYATPVGNIPLKFIDFTKQEKFIDLANKLIELNKKVMNSKTPKEKRVLEAQISKNEDKINQLVYELYNLTDEEIILVESVLEDKS